MLNLKKKTYSEATTINYGSTLKARADALKESDNDNCKTANTVDEAMQLIETDSEYICEYKDKRLFRKPK